MFELVMSTFGRVVLLSEEKNQNFWSLIVEHGVESQDKENRDLGTAR